MSSTSNVQDLLVNVFRPTYRYASNVGFVPSLVLSNISEVITDRLQTGAFVVSDTNRNTFIGSNAGANASSNGCVENVALGYSAMAGAVSSSNNTAFGYSNFYGLTNANSNVGIGPTVAMGRGNTNILIGPSVRMGDGSGNILIGSDISVGNVSKRLQLGTLLYGDLSSGFFGVNTSDPKVAFDISGTTVFRGKVGFQVEEPKYSLDVAGSIYSTERFFGGLGTVQEPVYSFEDASSSGMYVPSGYGVGAFAIATNGKPTAVFASNQVSFFQDLDVSGTFSACNVVLSAFSVQNGTAAAPTITFANDQTSGFFLVSSNNVGFTTNGTRKMVLLSNGDLSMGRALVSDISASGGIFSSSGSNNIGGVTLCNGNVILTGVATNTNLLVPGWIRNTDPATALDISGGNISNSLTTRSSNFRASAGTAGVPAYSFASDPSTGLHLVNGGSVLGFDTSGLLRMCISGGNVGIGTARPVVALEVVGDVSATTYNGPGGTEGAPHYTFSDDRTTGLFFPGANIVGLTAGGAERMRISNSNIGIGTKAPANALDVSGTLRVIGTAGDITFTNGAISIAGAPVISATGVLSNASSTSNSIGGVILSNRDLSMTATGRLLGSTAASNQIGGVTLSNFDLSLSTTGRILGVATVSNQIGGVTLSNFDLSLSTAGRILGVATASNQIGGVTLSNFDLSLSTTGRILGVPTASNRIGGVTLSNFDLSMASTGRILAPILRDAVTPVLYDISGGNMSNSGTLTSTNAIVSGYIRNALTPITYDISGGNISNAGTTRSSNFLGTVNSASNILGGVTLSNFDLSMASTGRILAPILRNALTPTTYDISGGNISNSGTLFTGNPRDLNAYASVEVGKGYLADMTGVGAPAMAFQYVDGGYRHFIRSRHINSVSNGNALDVFVNTGITGNVSTAPGTGNSHVISFTGGGVGIGTTAPTNALDISMASGPAAIVMRTRTATAGGAIGLQFSNGQGTAEIGLAGNLTEWAANSVSGDLVLRVPANRRIHLNANGSGGNAGLTASGSNIGIGTTTPSTTLDVSGTFEVASGPALFDVLPSGNFATTSTNGYFTVYKAGTTAKGVANIMVQLPSEVNTPYCFLSNNVGIGTRAAGTILDISAASVSTKTVAQVRCSDTGQAVLRLIGSNVADARGLELYHGGANTGLYAPSGQSNITFWTDGTQRMTLCNAGLGINCNAPAYALDVIAGSATAASVNMTTWPRSTGSNTLFVRGAINIVGNAIQLSNATQAIDATLATWTGVDATNGSSFIIKRSGTWALSFVSIWSNNGQYVALDVSTANSSNATIDGNLPTIAQSQFSTGWQTFSWTGYLPSNTGRFYKFRTAGAGTLAGTSNWYFQLTFLSESGQAIAFPY